MWSPLWINHWETSKTSNRFGSIVEELNKFIYLIQYEHREQDLYMSLLLLMCLQHCPVHRLLALLWGMRHCKHRVRQLLLDDLRSHLPFVQFGRHWCGFRPLHDLCEVLPLCLCGFLLRAHWRDLQLCEVHLRCLWWGGDRFWRYFEKHEMGCEHDQKFIRLPWAPSARAEDAGVQTLIIFIHSDWTPLISGISALALELYFINILIHIPTIHLSKTTITLETRSQWDQTRDQTLRIVLRTFQNIKLFNALWRKRTNHLRNLALWRFLSRPCPLQRNPQVLSNNCQSKNPNRRHLTLQPTNTIIVLLLSHLQVHPKSHH